VNLPKSGTCKIPLPKKWSQGGPKRQGEGDGPVLGQHLRAPPNKDKVTQFIGKPLK
jgi:hypothetical protein